ncbi:hypothetical protein VTH82DRAFT_6278 [Thermothelomyces myriococcoides]
MPPKIEPILLNGFCSEVQRELRFNSLWARAFQNSWFTDEHHPMWDLVDDPKTRREIRYGNNICVLFRALLHCKDFYGPDSFWIAISQGFKTNATVVRATAETLTKARREQQSKSTDGDSDTVRAVDMWINFLDEPGRRDRSRSNPNVYRVSEDFFKDQEKRHVDAARVFTNSPERSSDGGNTPVQSPTIQLGDPWVPDGHDYRSPPFRRKRSTSPEESASPKRRHIGTHTRRNIGKQPENHSTPDRSPTVQPTRSPPKVNQPQIAQTIQPAELVQPARSMPPTPKEESLLQAPASPEADDPSVLRARIASLEKQLEEAKNRQKNSESLSSPSLPNQLEEDMATLKKEMGTTTNAVSTMMESMHDVVDHLHSLQGEISVLATEQKRLIEALSHCTGTINESTKNSSFNLDAILRPLQKLESMVNGLWDEVSELQKRQATASSSSPAGQITGNDSKQIETILQSHTTRLDKLSQQMAALQQAQQQQQQQQHSSSRPQPQSLRQAIVAAEGDLRHHLATVEAFYNRGGASRGLTDIAADLLVRLNDAVKVARAGHGRG